MGVSKYNSEGYYDPTAYEALTKVAQEEKAEISHRGKALREFTAKLETYLKK